MSGDTMPSMSNAYVFLVDSEGNEVSERIHGGFVRGQFIPDDGEPLNLTPFPGVCSIAAVKIVGDINGIAPLA